MNTIGLQIKRVSGGAAPMLTINPGEWTRKVVDIRDILKLYEITDEAKFVTFMSFSEMGTYITILRPISGRDGDNTAAWLFVPNNIDVAGEDIIRLINDVKVELSKPYRDDVKLEDIFKKEYTKIESAAYLPSSTEKVYAKRQGPFYSMKDILGTKRYQPYYSQYCAILIEDEDSMKVIDAKVVDISQKRLEDTLVFCPPMAKDLNGQILVRFDDANRTPFTTPVRRKLGDRVGVVFERKGFQPIRHMDQVCENNQICSLPHPMVWKVLISVNQFKVSAANDGKNLSDRASIYINNQRLSFNKPIELDEREARNARVKISVSGYEDTEGDFDFLYNSTVQAQLHRAEREQEWDINLADGSPATMTLKSKYLSKYHHESPIKGYSAEGRRLEYTNFGILKQRVIGFGIACALFILTGICVCIYDWYETHTFEWELAWPPLKVEKISKHKDYSQTEISSTEADWNKSQSGSDDTNTIDSSRSIDGAISYLDNNDKWERDSLITYSELNGLFEELNRYEFDKIIQRKDILSTSNKFSELISAINHNASKNFNGTYNKENDFGITISKYIEKISKEETKPSTSLNNGGVASDAAKKANKDKKTKNGDTPSTSKQKPQRGGV